jgi:hypothetical protein
MLMYFPRTVAAIARHSLKANDKHNPGEPLHWARHKSTDQLNTALRHIMDHKMGVLTDGEYDNLVAAAWRICAACEIYLEMKDGIDAVGAWTEARAVRCPQHNTVPKPELKSISDIVAASRHIGGSLGEWNPSDNCNCETCRSWRNPVAMTFRPFDPDPLEETQPLLPLPVSDIHSEHCFLHPHHIGPCPEGPTMSLDDLRLRS